MTAPNRRAWQQQTLGIILIVLVAAMYVFARYRHALHLSLR
jgi:hypothetical protein